MNDYEQIVQWADEILNQSRATIILDTETTGLHGEIIELAMIDLCGNILFNSRFRPITDIEAGATAIHGIANIDLEDKPSWKARLPEIASLLESSDLVLIYNADFDNARIAATCQLHMRPMPFYRSACVMKKYAAYVGEWNDYRGDYKWQRLNGGHSALEDCQATLKVLKRMAAGKVTP